MFPATPTPLPLPPLAPVTIDATNWRIWSFADEAIMIWNTAPNSATQVIQVGILLVLAVAAIFLFRAWILRFTANEQVD